MSVALLVILGCVLAPLSLFAVWTRNTMLDTDRYVATVAPLATNQDVIDGAAARITAGVMERTDIKDRLKEALPPRAERAAPAMTRAIRGVVNEAALKLLSSDQFANVWKTANERVHPQIVAALTGNTSRVKLENGEVVVDLSRAADKVRTKISSLGFDLKSKLPDKQINTTIVLFHAPNATLVQKSVDALQTIAWVLPVVTLLCFAGALALSGNRRRSLFRIGIGVAIGMAVLVTVINLGRPPYLGLFPRAAGRLAGGAAYDQIFSSLRLQIRAIFVLAIVVALGAWLAGPSASAVRFRGAFTNRKRSGEPGGFSLWVAHSKVALRVVVIALGMIVLIALDQPTGFTVLVIAILVLVTLAVIELVGRPGSTAAATPQAHD